MISEETLEGLINEGLRWLLEQRECFLARARSLTLEERRALESYFEAETLTLARVARADRIEEPPFLSRVRAQGMPVLLDLRRTLGITFVDTIVVFGQGRPALGGRWLSLLFHELVHVVQYRLLGPERLIREYVHGWMENGLDYFRIPIEAEAYELERVFNQGGHSFSVEERIRRRRCVQEGPGHTGGPLATESR